MYISTMMTQTSYFLRSKLCCYNEFLLSWWTILQKVDMVITFFLQRVFFSNLQPTFRVLYTSTYYTRDLIVYFNVNRLIALYFCLFLPFCLENFFKTWRLDIMKWIKFMGVFCFCFRYFFFKILEKSSKIVGKWCFFNFVQYRNRFSEGI